MENKFTENLAFLMSDILGVSGNALAKELAINQGLVSRYRKGSTEPPAKFVTQLCKRYGISANWLLLNIEPIKLLDVVPSECDDWEIKQINKRQILISQLDELENQIKSIKENYL